MVKGIVSKLNKLHRCVCVFICVDMWVDDLTCRGGLFKCFLVYCPVCALNKYIISYNVDTLNSVLAQMC